MLAVGLNHRTAPLDVRERLAFTKDELHQGLLALRAAHGDSVILSTCNRTEVYTLTSAPAQGRQAVVQFLADNRGITVAEIDPYLYTLEHMEAVRHLYRVASGLDSMIIGESQILGQVRDAYGAAVAAGVGQGLLTRLFHEALRMGKRARTETGIGRNPLSVSYACVELVRSTLGDVRGRRVLVVGTGDAGKLAARALQQSGAAELLVTNRTFARAEELARELGGRALPFDQLTQALALADVVVTSTGSPGYVVSLDTIQQAVAIRRNGPLFLMDIAVPRDIDPAAADLPGVHLYDIDDLEAVSETNRRERWHEAEKVELLVREEVARFAQWWQSLDSMPIVSALRKQAEELRQREVNRVLRKMPQITDTERRHIEAMTRALVKKLLHHPTTVLIEGQDPQQQLLAQELFHLNGPDSQQP